MWWRILQLDCRGGNKSSLKRERLNLLKNTLSYIPTYYLSLFPLQIRVPNLIKKLFIDFLWDGLRDEPKFHILYWNKECCQIENGGL